MSSELRSGPVVIHMPTGPVAAVYTSHTNQVWLPDGTSATPY